jgi:hypothetical protein
MLLGGDEGLALIIGKMWMFSGSSSETGIVSCDWWIEVTGAMNRCVTRIQMQSPFSARLNRLRKNDGFPQIQVPLPCFQVLHRTMMRCWRVLFRSPHASF